MLLPHTSYVKQDHFFVDAAIVLKQQSPNQKVKAV